MANFKAVLFDFDGTIMNTNDIILGSWKHVYKTKFNYDLKPEEIVHTFGEPLRETMVERFPEEDPDEMVNLYRDFQRHIWKDPIHMFPGTKEMILGLKERGISVAIVTSRIWSSTTQGFYKFDISDMFDAVVSAEDTKVHKPNPEPCLICLEKLGIKPEEALFIGDSRFDIACAHNAGVKAALVAWSICMPEEKRVGIQKPDYVISTPEELFSIVFD